MNSLQTWATLAVCSTCKGRCHVEVVLDVSWMPRRTLPCDECGATGRLSQDRLSRGARRLLLQELIWNARSYRRSARDAIANAQDLPTMSTYFLKHAEHFSMRAREGLRELRAVAQQYRKLWPRR